jgi:poly(ADP-ribose) glycohydrolase
MFAQSPECLIGLMLCEVMAPSDALIIRGTLKTAEYTGYGNRLRFIAGNYIDSTPRKEDGSVDSTILAIDAVYFHYPGDSSQFSKECILRELVKLTAGFLDTGDLVIATGNWGCGAFNGNVQLKVILQWIAASAFGRKLRYFPFNNAGLKSLPDLHDAIIAKGVTVGELWKAVEFAASIIVKAKESRLSRPAFHFSHSLTSFIDHI